MHNNLVKISLALALCFSLLTCALCADSTANGSEDIVAFFKETISSQPDVVYFTGCERILRRQPLPIKAAKFDKLPTNSPPQFFEGARSGKNYYLRLIPANPDNALTSGRAGSNTFQINPHALTEPSEDEKSNPKNPVVSIGNSLYNMVGQFLNMGLGDVKLGSVTWQENEFSAVYNDGFPVYGRLEVSNNLPSRLEISNKKGGSPYKIFSYFYPNPPAFLGGFPEKIVFLSQFEDGLLPSLELTLSNVQLAKSPLHEEDFVATRFITRDITHTNIHGNGTILTLSPNGNFEKIPVSAHETTNDNSSAPTPRTLILVGMIVLAGIFISLLFWGSRR